MNRKHRTGIFYLIAAISTSAILFSSCSEETREGSVIFTQVTINKEPVTDFTIDSWRYKTQSSISSVNPDNPEKTFKVLTADFYSALSPRISFDGKFLLFAGQKKQNDSWQIWEMSLKNSETRQITSEKENCTDPAYLPGGRIVFSTSTSLNAGESIQSLYTCNTDGSEVQKITFNPGSYSSTNVLNDGRILTRSRQIFPEQKEALLMVLRPDGTKAELFYNCSEEKAVFGPATETSEGRIVFIESEKSRKQSGDLVSISYNRPLHSHVNYSSEIQGSFQSAAYLRSGKFLVSYTPSEAEKYSLFEFDTDTKSLGRMIYRSTDYDAVEAVVIEKRERPKKLPSEVDHGVKTGLLLCQDINFTGLISKAQGASDKIADRIEIIGADSSLGVVQVEEDGSFYLKVIADTPFRIRTLDEKGDIVNETCEWIYLRPNERRGCVGCHENHELVPENRLPLAVKKAPAVVPVHNIKIEEKVIELE
jgi:hypothetical protein